MKLPGVHCIIATLLPSHNKSGMHVILLTKRTYDAPRYEGYWSLPGGTPKINEKASVTARREVKEETGIDLPHLFYLTSVSLHTIDGINKIKYYYCNTSFTKTPSPVWIKEATAIGWFNAEEIRNLLLRPEDRFAINYYFKIKGY